MNATMKRIVGAVRCYSMERWCDKVAVVTGASSGIGRSTAQELARRGMKVVGLARRVEKIDEAAGEVKDAKGSLKGFKCDIKSHEDVTRAFEFINDKVGPVSVMINNAGININTTVREISQEDLFSIMGVNVLGLLSCTKEAMASMQKHKVDDGHIININSIVGHKVMQLKGIGVYTASKYAVTALTEGLRNELSIEKSMIRVTSISPGFVETEMTARMMEHLPKDVPRLSPEDITNSIIHVLSVPKHVNISEMTVEPTCENLELAFLSK